MAALLAEDLVLLRLGAAPGRLPRYSALSLVAVGALITDLAFIGAIDLPDGSHELGGPPATATATGHAADPLLAEVLAVIAAEPRSAREHVLELARRGLQGTIDRLVARGLIRQEHRRRLGLFPATLWVPVHPQFADSTRQAVANVLLKNTAPDPRLAALVALLDVTNDAHQVIDATKLASKVANRVANDISIRVTEGELAGVEAGRAIRATQYAVWSVMPSRSGAAGGGGGEAPAF